MPTRSRLLPVALIALALVSTPAVAAQARQQTAEDKELYAYVLTVDALRKAMRATQAMYEESMKDPRYKELAQLEEEIKGLEEKSSSAEEGLSEAEQARLDALREKQERLEDATKGPLGDLDAKTLSDMEAAVRKSPALAAALKREGLSAREYAKFWVTFTAAGMAHGLTKAGYGSKDMTSVVNPANLKFFQEHEKEIEAVMKESELVKKK